jgi:hypothetical protein
VTGAGCSGAACGTLSSITASSVSYTAPGAVPNPATVAVKVTSVADASKFTTASITVTAASGNITVSVTPRLAGVTVSQSQQFLAAVSGDPNNLGVSWAVDGVPGGNLSGGTISPVGVYMPGGTVGSHTVTATSLADHTTNATATIAVTGLTGVFTYHNDAARTGQNAQEYALNPVSLAENQFGKKFACAVDGYVYAQPLYVANLSIPSRETHNVVYVATEHDSVYAFDADDPTCKQIWQTSFLINGAFPVGSGLVGSNDIVPEIGVTGTPVIDSGSGTLYVVAKTMENGTCVQRLHALDIATGAEKFGGPQVIQASLPGTGDDSSGGTITFSPLIQNQRPALLLSGGIVYIGFASHGDNGPYHGWLLGYDAKTLKQVSAFNTTPSIASTPSMGGIWQGGGGPSTDGTGIYVITGNGSFTANSTIPPVAPNDNFGDSFLKLGTANGLSVIDYFTPNSQASLDASDLDLGSGGAVVLPDSAGSATHPHLLLGGGKFGGLYVLDRDNMGKFSLVNGDQVLQVVPAGGGIFSTPAYWGNTIFIQPSNGPLEAYPLTAGLLSTQPSSQSATSIGFPGPTPSISSSGATNGIVWVLDNSAFSAPGPAILHAYDATNLAVELYNSTQAGTRDQSGSAVKFTVPTAANGRVYVGGAYQLTVYGFLAQ